MLVYSGGAMYFFLQGRSAPQFIEGIPGQVQMPACNPIIEGGHTETLGILKY
jgi:hypothetical protein